MDGRPGAACPRGRLPPHRKGPERRESCRKCDRPSAPTPRPSPCDSIESGGAPGAGVESRPMDIHSITPDYSVAPQIGIEDVQAVRDAGFAAIICNRPDAENPPELQSEALRAAARDAGLAFFYNPVTNGALSQENLDEQANVLDEAAGPVFAYCRSGTRSTVVWALSRAQAGDDVDQILAAAARAGYDIGGLRPQLEAQQR